MDKIEFDYLIALWKALDCVEEDKDREKLQGLFDFHCATHALDAKTVHTLFVALETHRELKV